jgi:hypothetical protein
MSSLTSVGTAMNALVKKIYVIVLGDSYTLYERNLLFSKVNLVILFISLVNMYIAGYDDSVRR